MNDTLDFISKQWQTYAEALHNQVGNTLIDLINKEINLDKIIEDDNAKRLAEYNEALKQTADKEIKSAMQYSPIKFNWIEDKLQYALQALYHKDLAITHNVLPNWIVDFKFYTLKSKYQYRLNWTYSASIAQCIDDQSIDETI